jgi:radical SAM superfamily enzyme YgiQ (UPF0313 family)
MDNLVNKPTKCLLVRPEFLRDTTFYNLTKVYSLLGAKAAAPPLGLLIVAALLPDNWELKLVDHDVAPLTDEHLAWADIVFVGGIGPQEKTILDVVMRAQALGKPVAVGGSGPTLQPDIYSEADFVVAGEAEDTIPLLLDDLRKGATSGLYVSARSVDLKQPVLPRYDLAQLDEYMFVGLNYTRGCPFTCEFCAQIEIFGRTPRTKTSDQVLEELQTLFDLGYRGMIDLGYDNLIGDPVKTTSVLRAMRDWGERHDYPFCYSTEATLNLAKHPELMRLMQENDFRYVFIGIESGDDDVLAQTKKGQNTIMPVAEAVKLFNQHGMIINTGLILGFDSESERSADNMLDMVQRTAAFPTLVLPLHALPNTQLSRRLEREGRLFGDGHIAMNTKQRTDTATTGLNFVTVRPRTDIQRDLARVLNQLYQPEQHFERVMRTATQLRPSGKHKPPLSKLLRLLPGVYEILTTMGVDKMTAPHFWRAIIKIALRNPRALEAVVALAVLNDNYAKQSVSYIEALEEQIARVEELGEQQFNELMVAGPGTDAAASAASRGDMSMSAG